MAATTSAFPSRVEASADLAASLGKIRHHTASKLENQKAPAQLLVAIEATLDEQRMADAGDAERSPTEYFCALEAMLAKALGDGAPATLLPSSFYLLSIVAPYVAPAVLKARLTGLMEPLAFVLSNPHPSGSSTAENHAALLRSALGVLQAVLLALSTDRATLDRDLRLRGCWNSVLELCTDSRPKVRRRAQDVVSAVLAESGAGSSTGTKAHPYTARTAEWAIKALEGVANAGGVASTKGKASKKPVALAPEYDKKSGKAKGADAAAAARQQQASDGGASAGIWVCGFLKLLAPTMPGKYLTPLINVLLRLPGLTNPFLTVAAFEVFESLFRPSRPVAGSENPLAALASSGAHASRAVNQTDSLVRTLDALASPSIAPSASDAQLLPPYLRALEHALVAYSRVEQGKPAWARVPAVWAEIFELSLSSKSKASREQPAVRSAGRDSLCALARYCVPDSAIEEALKAGKGAAETQLGGMLSLISDALGRQAIRYSHARPEVLAVLSALVTRLRYRPTAAAGKQRALPAAAKLLMPLVSIVAELRVEPAFDHREAADGVLGAAVEVCGPRTFLETLPLGLLGENDATGGRAWLLPLMRGRITNTELEHFTGTMVPLSEALFNRRAQAEELGQDGKMKRPVEAKVFEALTEQVWALFPGYCDLPVDLTSALSPHFIELLANVLYTQPTLRPSVCRGLQVLVERNEALASSGAPADVLRASFGLDQDAGRKNIAHLADLAPNLLAVFSNIFSQSPGESRGYVAEVLAAYLRVMKPADVASTYAKIVGMLRSSLPTLVPAHDRETGPKVVPPVPHTMLDLLIVLLPFLDASKPDSEASQLFDLATEDELMRAKDAGLQKKTYRILARLIDGPRGVAVLRLPSTAEGGEGAGRVGELLAKLRDSTANVVAGAKRDRVALLAALVPRIPATELHFLPSIIPEAVLATKETNQGTRELAYDLLVAMGHKMDAGGSIKRGLVEGAAGEEADEDMEGGQAAAPAPAAVSEEVAAASVNEYMTMVAAGLAGSTPHMISASITALSRLVYEFRADVPVETLHELLSTIEVFIRSANREIVKSALGFVKVVIVSLQASIVDEHLPVLIPALFGFSPQHRQHFKSKIRHIFERLLRRFGFERVVSLTGEEDKKLLNNIRKRKERAKRRKNSAEDGERAADDDDDAGPGIGARALKSHGVDAFEEAIYGSESDLSDSDDDNAGDGAEALAQRASDARGAKGGKKGQQPVKPKKTRRQEEETYIREDDDVPMDLLDRSAAAGGISTARATSGNGKAARARRPGQEAATFELDEATGRMLINDPDSASGQAADPASVDVDGAGRAYTDRERGTHGVTMRDGVVRVNKNNKRNRAEDELLDEEQMAVEAAAEGAQDAAKAKRKKKAPQAIGAAYAAKRAQGDVSRKGAPSPFAYVPLGQVAGKKGARADKMDITGKGKKGPRGRL